MLFFLQGRNVQESNVKPLLLLIPAIISGIKDVDQQEVYSENPRLIYG
jgi:hypothetical protein